MYIETGFRLTRRRQQTQYRPWHSAINVFSSQRVVISEYRCFSLQMSFPIRSRHKCLESRNHSISSITKQTHTPSSD